MYKIKHSIEKNILEVKNSDASVFGKIYLNDGGSLQELVLNGEPIIADLQPLVYKNTYASSILFPFANRIKDGKYRFNNQDFQFEINHEDERNAIHGLVYNKSFNIIKQVIKKQQAKIVLSYQSQGDEAGFPFPLSYN